MRGDRRGAGKNVSEKDTSIRYSARRQIELLGRRFAPRGSTMGWQKGKKGGRRGYKVLPPRGLVKDSILAKRLNKKGCEENTQLKYGKHVKDYHVSSDRERIRHWEPRANSTTKGGGKSPSDYTKGLCTVLELRGKKRTVRSCRAYPPPNLNSK